MLHTKKSTSIQQKGISHMELMITVALVAIVAASAVPNLKELMSRSQLLGTRQQLLTDLNFARHSAIDQSQRTVICPSIDQQFCSGNTRWNQGWIVFQDPNSNNLRDQTEPLLLITELDSKIDIISGQRKRFRFYPDGTAPGSTGSLYLCMPNQLDTGHRLVISNVGRIRNESYHCS